MLQFALLLVFLNRRFFLFKFPAFFRYIGFSVAANVLLISLNRQKPLYFWVYWIAQVIYALLALFVMREVFQMVWEMKQGARRFLVWIVTLILGVTAVGVGLHYSDGRDLLTAFEPACRTFIASVHVIEVALCSLAIWLVRRLTRYHLGIMLGFGVSGIAQVLAFIGHFYDFGPTFNEVVVYAPVSAYIGASGSWLFTFIYKPRVTRRLDPDEVLAWINEQERIAREISAGLGLKWPEKIKKNRDKRCAATLKEFCYKRP